MCLDRQISRLKHQTMRRCQNGMMVRLLSTSIMALHDYPRISRGRKEIICCNVGPGGVPGNPDPGARDLVDRAVALTLFSDALPLGRLEFTECCFIPIHLRTVNGTGTIFRKLAKSLQKMMSKGSRLGFVYASESVNTYLFTETCSGLALWTSAA